MNTFSFIDRDGDTFNAVEPEDGNSLIEVNLNGCAQYINFYATDAPALIKIIQQAAGIES